MNKELRQDDERSRDLPPSIIIRGWQIEEIERREANLMRNPASALTWEMVVQKIRTRVAR
jgi:hypothetical protein